LHSYGLPEGYDKLVVADIIGLLIEALKGIGLGTLALLSNYRVRRLIAPVADQEWCRCSTAFRSSWACGNTAPASQTTR
jgi:hypothetical protein